MRLQQAGAALFAVAFVVLGLPDFGHGVAWPDLRADLDRPLADLGTFLAVAAGGYLVVATQTGRLAQRWGVEGLVLRATGASAVGLLTIAVAPAWPVVLTGSLLSGAGAGGMDTGLNAAVALRGDGRLMGLLHAGYGIGAAIGPVVVGASLATGGGWRPAYAVFAAGSLLLVVPLMGTRLGDAPAQVPMGSPRGLLLPCLAFVVYVSLEVTIGQWAFTSLTRHRGLGELGAAAWVGLYWVALTAGRLWLGFRGHHLPPRRLLGLAVTGAGSGAVILWLGGSIAPAGLLVAGLSLSVVFPLLMLLTPERVGAERASAAVGWQTASASIGAAGGPALAGVVLDGYGVEAYGPITLAIAAALAVVVGSRDAHLANLWLKCRTKRAPRPRVWTLVDVFRFFLDHQHTNVGGRHRPHLNIVIDKDALAHEQPGRTMSGVPLPGLVVRKLACDAAIHRVITDGPGSILDYGRSTRTIPPAVYTSLVLRDWGCRFPGCDRPAQWCEGTTSGTGKTADPPTSPPERARATDAHRRIRAGCDARSMVSASGPDDRAR